mgnify:FL=1
MTELVSWVTSGGATRHRGAFGFAVTVDFGQWVFTAFPGFWQVVVDRESDAILLCTQGFCR